MDFLRSSGHDNGSRERKPSSYGSLGTHYIGNNFDMTTIIWKSLHKQIVRGHVRCALEVRQRNAPIC